MKLFQFIVLALLLAPFVTAQEKLGQDTIKITILYDNIPFDDNLKTSFGFSALVEKGEKKVLFDTGGKEDMLIYNMKQKGIDPKTIDIIVISHDHWDHYGSIVRLLEYKPSIPVYIPASSWKNVQELIRIFRGDVIPVSGTTEIMDNLYLTGDFENKTKEQSLAIKTNKGVFLLTGGGHWGIENMVYQAKKALDQDVYFIAGGMLLKNKTNEEIVQVITNLQENGVEFIAPSHCTGDSAFVKMKEHFKDKYIDSGVGKTFILSN
jgi:7,8-dihydropterin-6-yl-methyl-4-(beta-D-ribofuranosyl)aminobenzene 5'-phosphate synthase